MCALTPMYPTRLGWAPTECHYVDSFLDPLHHSLGGLSHSRSNSNGHSGGGGGVSGGDGGDGGKEVMKKLSHNASERDRRKKLNALYTSLRSLLPASDATKKLSIPGTVSHVLKYIPELRQEVEKLSRKKEQLKKRISRHTSIPLAQGHEQQTQRKLNNDMSSRIMTNWLNDTEVVILVADLNKSQVSDTLLGLEENGLRVISVSSSVSSSSRVFHTLHIQVDGDCLVKAQELSDMIFALQEKQDQRNQNQKYW